MLSNSIKIILVYALACLIWGSTWIAIKTSLDSLTPFLSAGLRFVIASTFILLILKITKTEIQKDKLSIRLYLVMTFFSFVFPFGLVYWAEQFVPTGLSSVLFAVNPFFVVLFAYFLISSEKIGFFKFTGIILGFAGILVIFSGTFNLDYSAYTLGMIAIILSASFQALNSVFIKKYGGHLNPISMNFIPMLLGGIILSVSGLFLEDTSIIKFDSTALLAVLYLAIFGSIVTFTSFYWLLKRISVVILSLIAFITPVIALFLGWIFFSEQLSFNEMMGSLLVLFGLLWANFGNIIKLNKMRNKVTV
ncbi:MAG: EamA family transporter [Ignavibacteriaceae bacterium]|jgi:drug/metabolite transporter (DMT)-like permease